MSEKYVRKCENWLSDFGKWTLPRSEAPETFIFWTGLFTLSSVLKRRVSVPKRLLGSWSAAPNLYILFIAPAGKARKSTTANYAEELVDLIPNVTKAPEIVTKEAVLTKLVKSDDASMCIVAPEFGEFIVKSGTDMFGFLTNMYDGKKNISAATITRGAEFAAKPCVNLLGATTPEWVAENMPESVIGGGFASRVIFIFEERVRRRKLFYDDLDQDNLTALHDALSQDLRHISEDIEGEFSFTPDAKEFMENWYDNTSEEGSAASYKLHGYFERRPAHVLKVAMLLHIAYSDELVLHIDDIRGAIALLKQVEEKLPSVFQSIGRNPYTVDMHRILDYITQNKRVMASQVYNKFMHAATPLMLKELVYGLYITGYITMVPDGEDSILELAIGLPLVTDANST